MRERDAGLGGVALRAAPSEPRGAQSGLRASPGALWGKGGWRLRLWCDGVAGASGEHASSVGTHCLTPCALLQVCVLN